MADLSHAMEGWEWDGIFASSLLDEDLVWHSDFGESQSMIAHTKAHPSSGTIHLPDEELLADLGNGIDAPVDTSNMIATNTSDGSLESGPYNHDTPVSSNLLHSETSFVNPPPGKKKKRDPRLECPNFLAGRVPCSCPEEDELEEDAEGEALVKKKPKVGARCQVPSCGGDISHLKGYHQRHRVCLECAYSPRVMLKDQAHRYCQQCGKFHRLSAFDEGKRSCRRKLDRHNRLRRRRTVEGGEAEESEEPLPGVYNVESASQDIATPQGQITAASKKQTGHAQAAATQHKTEGTGQDTNEPLMVDDLHASHDSSASLLILEQEVMSLDESKFDEHALLTMLMGNASEGAAGSSTRVPEQLPTSETGSQKVSQLSKSQKRCPAYVSPCPTGRISFKLYDWNPADFPRRLRQQIFEWLANMPVELESYIRSGCIILTFFISMPPTLWDKVLADWIGCIQTYIHHSKAELWGSVQVVTQMTERRICLKSDTLMSADKKDVLVPVLVDLYPRSLEAGCHMPVYVYGLNLSGSRLIISFGGGYTECTDWEPVEHCHFSHQPVWHSTDNLEVQKATVFLPSAQKYGVAFLEVDSVHGVSNFMPLLVADKSVCLEINALSIGFSRVVAKQDTNTERIKAAKVSRYDHAMEIVADLGWTLKYMNKLKDTNTQAEIREASTTRLYGLLALCLEHGLHATAERLVQVALNTIRASVIVGADGNRSVQNIPIKTKGLIDILAEKVVPFLHQEFPKSAMLSEIYSIRAANSSIQIEEPRGALARFSSAVISLHCEEVDNDISKCYRHMEPSLVEDRIPILEDRSRQRKGSLAQPLSWARKPMTATGVSVLGSNNRRFFRVVVAAVSIVTVCTGMCFMLQHPHGVAEISMTIRRCLWSATRFQHV